MPETLEMFFGYLAERFSDENSLSDVTYALMKASPSFMSFLAKFFEFDIKPEEPCEIWRERSSEDSRPDFLIMQRGSKYLIENKLYDQNYHFQQYYKRYKDEIPCEKQAFIANYRVADAEIEDNFKGVSISVGDLQEIKKRVKTWGELVESLEKQIKDDSGDEKSILSSYLKYVRGVCYMEELKLVGDLSHVSSLHDFKVLVEHVIANTALGPDVKNVPRDYARQYSDCCSGKYMELNKEGYTTLFPSMGIWFYRGEPPIIYICFEKDWNTKLYETVKERGGGLKGTTFSFEVNENDEQLDFNLKTDVMDAFASQSLDLQRQTLEQFLKEVMTAVKPFWT